MEGKRTKRKKKIYARGKSRTRWHSSWAYAGMIQVQTSSSYRDFHIGDPDRSALTLRQPLHLIQWEASHSPSSSLKTRLPGYNKIQSMKNQTRLLDADQLDVWSPPLPNFCGWAFRLDLNAGWFASGQTCISTHSTHSQIWILLKVSWSSRHLAYTTLCDIQKHYSVLQRNTHPLNTPPWVTKPTMSFTWVKPILYLT